MRLEPLEVYVLESFRAHDATQLDMAEIAEGCTVNRRNALREAVSRLESDDLVVRRPETLELTPAGRRYLGLAEAEAHERLR
jgi:hypothetical protein